MAGIGFNLQKILEGDTYIDSVKAHFYSVLITAGPWILSILTLFLLGFVHPANMDDYELTFFRTAITYIYAFSLIVAGLIQLSLTRYLADKLYIREKEALVPAFNSACVLTLGLQSVAGIILALGVSGEPLQIRLLIFLIYMTISLLWLLMVFLTALWDYHAIVGCFAIGSVLTIGLGWALGLWLGLAGYFAGYLAGHLVMAALLSSRIFIEFQGTRAFDRGLFQFFLKNKTLVLIGFIYNLAIWIDKIIFWTSSTSTEVSGLLRMYPAYEGAVFFGYITTVPSMAIFLIKIETDFYRRYRAFYHEVLQRGSYKSIHQKRNALSVTLGQNILYVVKYQGIITLAFVTFAPDLIAFLQLPWDSIPVFRIACLGAFLHSLLLVVILIAMYFDFKPLVLEICIIFLLTNTLLSWATVFLPSEFLGYGYFFSVLLTLIAAYYRLDFKIKRLEFTTFASQPVGVHQGETKHTLEGPRTDAL